MAKGTILTTRRSGGSSGGQGSLVFNEEAAGTKNHLNKVFTTADNFVAGTLSVYYNGQRLGNIDYTETNNSEFELIYVKPYSVDHLMVDYVLQNL